MISPQKWFVIINPNAGNGKAQKKWRDQLMQAFQQGSIIFEYAYTKAQNHATELAQNAIKQGYRRLIGIGGDGTFNEIVNGVATQNYALSTDITLCFLPAGTGNDWVKTFNIPTKTEQIVQMLQKHKTYLHDIGKVVYQHAAQKKERFFLNVAGTGFDAYIGQKMENKAKWLGKITYMYELLSGLVGYKNIEMGIKNSANTLKTKVFSINVSICQYFGSGMKIAPTAVPNDGLLDVTLIENFTKMDAISQLKNLYDGSFVKHPKISTYKTQAVEIKTSQIIYLQLDGEMLNTQTNCVQFEVMPLGLKVVVNN